jgi:glutathione peroxidase
MNVRLLRACLLTAVLAVVAPWVAAAECPALLRYTVPTLLDEKPESLCQYAGKVVLVVNTASYCGFTPQYEGLEKLHARLKDRGFVVIGFPSNDFGSQEPGSAKQIKEFCEGTYGVRFPMYSKTTVRGPQMHPFYVGLVGAAGRAPQWNFHKYLIDRQGKTVVSFDSQVDAGDRRLLAQIDGFLASPFVAKP